jgi:hypothetical protein
MGCFSPPLSPFAFDSVPPYGPSPCGHVASLLSKLPTSLQQFCKNLLCIGAENSARCIRFALEALLSSHFMRRSAARAPYQMTAALCGESALPNDTGALRRERPTK